MSILLYIISIILLLIPMAGFLALLSSDDGSLFFLGLILQLCHIPLFHTSVSKEEFPVKYEITKSADRVQVLTDRGDIFNSSSIEDAARWNKQYPGFVTIYKNYLGMEAKKEFNVKYITNTNEHTTNTNQ